MSKRHRSQLEELPMATAEKNVINSNKVNKVALVYNPKDEISKLIHVNELMYVLL